MTFRDGLVYGFAFGFILKTMIVAVLLWIYGAC